MYSKTTRGIKINVTPVFIHEQSVPISNKYVWAYHIVIENTGNEIVQLLDRYWHITDSLGKLQEVRGPGVVGYQPLLRPTQFFEYTSGVSLDTNSGIMKGHYLMQNIDGEKFEVEVPAFSLDLPNVEMVLN